MRKVARIVRNIIVKGFLVFDFIVFIMSICAADDHILSAMAVCMMSFAILIMYAIASGAMEW